MCSIAAPRRIRLRFAFRPNAVALSGNRPKPASLRSVCEFKTNDKGGGDFSLATWFNGAIPGLMVLSEDISSLFGSFGWGSDDQVTRISLFGNDCATILYISIRNEEGNACRRGLFFGQNNIAAGFVIN